MHEPRDASHKRNICGFSSRENKDRCNLNPRLNPMKHQQHQQHQQTLSHTGSIVDSLSIDIRKLDANQLLKDSFQPQKPDLPHKQMLKCVHATCFVCETRIVFCRDSPEFDPVTHD